MAVLRVEEGDDRAPFEVPLGTEELGIGRGLSNGLSFANPWLSRFHARIFQRGGEFVLEDLGSRNGTFLNHEALHGQANLQAGDLIALGDLRLRYLAPTLALKVADSDLPLDTGGTMIIASEDLVFDRYREQREPEGDGVGEASLLPALNEAASALIVNYEVEELLPKVLELVERAVPSERSALLLREGEGSELEIKAARGLDHQSLVISRTLVEEVLVKNRAVLTVDAQSDDRFEGAQSILMEGIRSVICAPLWNNKEVIGLVYLDHRFGGRSFGGDDLRLLGLLANMAAVKIENTRLLAEQIEKRRMEEQLAVGAQIQRKLLPDQDPQLAGYDIRGTSQPCYEVGGDYYDFVAKKDGQLAVLVGDISGKGIGAALLMAVLQASVRTLVHRTDEPATLVAELNQVLVENSPSNKFSTLFYGELDPEAHRFTYVNGGHNPPLVVRAGFGVEGMEELDSTGPLVGLIPGARFEARTIALNPGDTLFVYTDGISEREDNDGEEIGTEGLAKFLAGQSIADSRELILGLRRFLEGVGSGDPEDDSTVVVLRRLPLG